MIYTVTLNPAWDKTATIPDFSFGQVNRIQAVREDIGGKGINVSKCISALGGESTAIVLLAGYSGKRMSSLLAQEPHIISKEFWASQGETRTNIKIVDPIHHCNTDINEPGPMIDAETLKCMEDFLTSSAKHGDIVVLSGSLPKGTAPTLYRDWGTKCREKGVHVFLDADGDVLAYGLECKPFLIKPNQAELSTLMKRPITTRQELLDAGHALHEKYRTHVVISMGSDGALFLDNDDLFYISAPKANVVSTVGAGDSMVAAFAYGTSMGLSWREQAKLAIACGSASVTNSGSQPPDWKTVHAFLQQIHIQALST